MATSSFGSVIQCTGESHLSLETLLKSILTATPRNTRSTSTGVKTRSFASVLSELSTALQVHKREGSILGGMHLELTGDAVTECTGGSEGLQDEDLSLRYETFCDPRLNEKQALEIAFLVAQSQRGSSI